MSSPSQEKTIDEETKVKPVLKKPDETAALPEHSSSSHKDHHLKWDTKTVSDEPHECEPEFIQHRKQHYKEMEEVRKFRQEHPGDVLEEVTQELQQEQAQT